MKRSKLLTLRRLIVETSATLDDTEALTGVELFRPWSVGIEVTQGERLRYGTDLYRVEQSHTTQAEWTPDVTPALYSQVGEPGQGDTPDNPIPYNNNMELHKDKYYSQDGVVYVCIRDTGVPVYNNLADLVGLYVEVWVG